MRPTDTATAPWSFGLVVGLPTLTPGLDTALVLRTAGPGHRRHARGVVLGIQTDTFLGGALTSLGVTALPTASQFAPTCPRWAGVACLVETGGRMLASPPPGTGGRADATGDGPAGAEAVGIPAVGIPAVGLDEGPRALLGGFRQGAPTNPLNPKVGVFHVAVLPPFIPPGTPHFARGVLLTSVRIAPGLAWSSPLVAFARRLRGVLREPQARRVLDRITGTVNAAFGVRLAAEG